MADTASTESVASGASEDSLRGRICSCASSATSPSEKGGGGGAGPKPLRLRIDDNHFEWLSQMADVHNFGNVRKTLRDVLNYYVACLHVEHDDVEQCLRSMSALSCACSSLSRELRQDCLSSEQSFYLDEWARKHAVTPSALLFAICQHAILEGDEEQLFESPRMLHSTRTLYLDCRLSRKITVDQRT